MNSSATALLFTLLGIVSMTNAQQSGNCREGFTQYGESCYAYMQGKQSWADAEQLCVSIHTHLVEIFTSDEMKFVQNFSMSNGDHDVWLGAHDLVQENLWTWAWSGSSFDVKFWAPGEPNDDDDGKENCMELNEDSWLWNDEDCSHKKHFICQMSLNEELIG